MKGRLECTLHRCKSVGATHWAPAPSLGCQRVDEIAKDGIGNAIANKQYIEVTK
jgi:hypothetical protein